jgi:hypothetical protein
MLKDPLLTWPSGPFPYDALAAKITPASNMQEIKDAFYELVEQGLWNREAQLAWDELRFVEKRLWVDLFLFPITLEELVATLANTWEQQESELLTKDLDVMLEHDLNELQQLVAELEQTSKTGVNTNHE